MNRYKSVAIETVNRWYFSGEFLVDRHITLDLLGQGILAVVYGLPGSGKTTLARRMCERMQNLGLRSPSLIDEVIFSCYLDPSRRHGENIGHDDIFRLLKTMSRRSHAPIVAVGSTLLSATALFSSDLIWYTSRNKHGEHMAKLIKSRAIPDRSVEVKFQTNQEFYNRLRCPYYQAGIETARLVRQVL